MLQHVIIAAFDDHVVHGETNASECLRWFRLQFFEELSPVVEQRFILDEVDEVQLYEGFLRNLCRVVPVEECLEVLFHRFDSADEIRTVFES